MTKLSLEDKVNDGFTSELSDGWGDDGVVVVVGRGWLAFLLPFLKQTNKKKQKTKRKKKKERKGRKNKKKKLQSYRLTSGISKKEPNIFLSRSPQT